MFTYTARDRERRWSEAPKIGQLDPAIEGDDRGVFARDRARVLHSAALRRLADKTQVVGPRDGDTPRTRLTHSLEVAQISRSIGSGLGLDPDLCEMAGLTHDIGHPPYGHNGERALDTIAADFGGFEGNAQTLRILTRLEPKILAPDGRSVGLNLARASLDAACKYPWTRTNPDGTTNRKYNAYDEDAEILAWIRADHAGTEKCIEAQIMDLSDDVAYSVHDVEDGIMAGRVDLEVLRNFVELSALAEQGATHFGGSAEELVEAADHLRGLACVNAVEVFEPTLQGFVNLKRMTSELVGRFVGATIAATISAAREAGEADRRSASLVVPEEIAAEVRLLKMMAVRYVMEDEAHIARQDRQTQRMYAVFEYLWASEGGALDPMYRAWFQAAESEAHAKRVIIDAMASMTESRLERIAAAAHGFAD